MAGRVRLPCGCIWERLVRDAWRWATQVRCCRRLISWWITSRRFWMLRTWSSSIPYLRGTAGPRPVNMRASSMASRKTCSRGVISSDSTQRATSGGRLQNSWRARVTGRRAAGLSGYLQQRYGMYLNGIILVSTILNFETADFNTGNDLPYILYLPTYTAIAWYHKRLPTDLQSDLHKAVEGSENFAKGEYSTALMAGDALPNAKHLEIVSKLARLTGLSPDYIERTNMRVEIERFMKELLRSERRTVGRIDGRFTGIDRDAAGDSPEYDPSIAAIIGP